MMIDDPGDKEIRPTGRHNGSYHWHCDRFCDKMKCKVCSHRKEISTIFSFHSKPKLCYPRMEHPPAGAGSYKHFQDECQGYNREIRSATIEI